MCCNKILIFCYCFFKAKALDELDETFSIGGLIEEQRKRLTKPSRSELNVFIFNIVTINKIFIN